MAWFASLEGYGSNQYQSGYGSGGGGGYAPPSNAPPGGYGAPPGGSGYGPPPGAPPSGGGSYGPPPGGPPGGSYGGSAGGPPPPSNHTRPGTVHRPRPPSQIVDPQLRTWFSAVDRDNSGHISPIELQQALVNGDWTPFDLDTVKMLSEWSKFGYLKLNASINNKGLLLTFSEYIRH